MIKEAYCSYEVAKLLKEKGFDEKTTHWYNVRESLINDYPVSYENFGNPEKVWLAPTHQMACAWLREVHNIDIEIRRSPNTMMYRSIIYKDTLVKCITDAIMETYEQAVEAALKYALENLI